jgi:hypothetical protein
MHANLPMLPGGASSARLIKAPDAAAVGRRRSPSTYINQYRHAGLQAGAASILHRCLGLSSHLLTEWLMLNRGE